MTALRFPAPLFVFMLIITFHTLLPLCKLSLFMQQARIVQLRHIHFYICNLICVYSSSRTCKTTIHGRQRKLNVCLVSPRDCFLCWREIAHQSSSAWAAIQCSCSTTLYDFNADYKCFSLLVKCCFEYLNVVVVKYVHILLRVISLAVTLVCQLWEDCVPACVVHAELVVNLAAKERRQRVIF